MRFWRFLASSCERAYLSYATEQGFAKNSKGRKMCRKSCFDQTNSFFSFVCLLLVCSFSPKVQKYLLGFPSPIKRREFDGFLGFFAGSENPSVLSVHEFSGSAKTPKRRELSPFYKKNFGRAHVCSPRRLPEIISKCYDCGNAACW